MKKNLVFMAFAIAVCVFMSFFTSCSSSFDEEVEDMESVSSNENAKGGLGYDSTCSAEDGDELDWFFCEDSKLQGTWKSERVIYVKGPVSGVKDAVKILRVCIITFSADGIMDVEVTNIPMLNDDVNGAHPLDLGEVSATMLQRATLHCNYTSEATGSVFTLTYGTIDSNTECTYSEAYWGDVADGLWSNYESLTYRYRTSTLIIKGYYPWFDKYEVDRYFTKVTTQDEEVSTGIRNITM